MTADRGDYRSRHKAAQILQPPGHRRDSLEALAEGCGLNLLQPIDSRALLSQANIAPIRTPDFLLTDIQSEPDQMAAALDAIAPYLNEYGTEVLVWVSADQLDLVAAALSGPSLHILCEAQDFEAIPILTGALTKMKMQGLRQDDSHTDYRSLHRISDELADFAKTLARIAEQDDSSGNRVNDKPVSFRAAPSAIFDALVPKVETPPEPSGPSAAAVRNILKLRRKRDSYFAPDLFADPAWDILLDLYASSVEDRKVSVSSLCIAAAVPPTTALRWISAMTENGLLVRELDPGDARRVFIQLSDSARESMHAYFIDTGTTANASI